MNGQEMTRQRWHNPVNGRYYYAYISKDLLETWGVTVCWGGSKNSGGRIKTFPCDSFDTALLKMQEISEVRRKHKYV